MSAVDSIEVIISNNSEPHFDQNGLLQEESAGDRKSIETMNLGFTEHCVFCLRKVSDNSSQSEIFSTFFQIVPYILQNIGDESEEISLNDVLYKCNDPLKFSRLPPLCQLCAEKLQEVDKCVAIVKSQVNKLATTVRDLKRSGQYSFWWTQFERQLKGSNVESGQFVFTVGSCNEPGVHSAELESENERGNEETDELEKYSKTLAFWRCLQKAWRSQWRNRLVAGVLVWMLLVSVMFGMVRTGVHYACTEDDSKLALSGSHVMSWDLFTDNMSIDPCDNFFHFACQNWYRNNPRPVNATEWSTFVIYDNEMDRIIAAMLEEPVEPTDIPAYQQAQQFYKNCLEFMSQADNVESTISALKLLWKTMDDYNNVFTESKHINWKEQKMCVYYTQEIFKFPVGQKYLKRIYKDTSKIADALTEVNFMAKYLKKSLKEHLKEFGGDSQSLKINDIKVCSGYPHWLFNDTRVQKEYEKLNLHQATFPAQVLNAVLWSLERKFELKKELVSNKREAQKCQWSRFPGGADTYFDTELFHIYIPMGHIQDSISKPGDHLAAKYGVFGFAMGHELSHALYPLGYKTYDNSTLTPTEECFVKQYSGFTVRQQQNENVYLDGKRTLEENFSDNGGLKIAYNAFRKVASLEKRTGRKSKFTEKASYSEDQMFFLKFAQDFCADYTLPEIQYRMHDYDHSPSMFRVLGTLQNSEEFAKAWNCPVGSKMNPDPNLHAKCSIFS